MTQPDKSDGRVVYVLKAACSNCGQYGTVDDMTLVCSRCGMPHAITPAERQQRDADTALWRSVGANVGSGRERHVP